MWMKCVSFSAQLFLRTTFSIHVLKSVLRLFFCIALSSFSSQALFMDRFYLFSYHTIKYCTNMHQNFIITQIWLEFWCETRRCLPKPVLEESLIYKYIYKGVCVCYIVIHRNEKQRFTVGEHLVWRLSIQNALFASN